MKDNGNKVEMTAPPQKAATLVKIKARTAIRLKDGTEVSPDQVVEVEEGEAAEFCRSIEGNFAFTGENHSGRAPRHTHQRAERVA